jgi:hypothetical protein
LILRASRVITPEETSEVVRRGRAAKWLNAANIGCAWLARLSLVLGIRKRLPLIGGEEEPR